MKLRLDSEDQVVLATITVVLVSSGILAILFPADERQLVELMGLFKTTWRLWVES